MIYLALNGLGLVVAQFLHSAHAESFCSKHKLCMVPLNLQNRDNTPAPAIGSVYLASLSPPAHHLIDAYVAAGRSRKS